MREGYEGVDVREGAAVRPLPEPLETLRLAYANACERLGIAHASGTREEWQRAEREEERTRGDLYRALMAILPRGSP